MTKDATEIEVEVLEIDGIKPSTSQQDPRNPQGHSPYVGGFPLFSGKWGRKILNLDWRWWPLWIVLGVLAIIFMATVGLVLGLVWLAVKLIGSLFSTIFGGVGGGK